MPTRIVVPEFGESVSEARVGRWLKSEGDSIEAGEPVVELETDKVDLEVGAEGEGVLSKIEKGEGSEVKPGDVLGIVEPQEVKGKPAKEQRKPDGEAKAKAAAEPEPRSPRPQKERATPTARKIAEERGVDLERITGSGGQGRIVREDVEAFLETLEEKPKAPPEGEPSPAPRPERHEERRKMSTRRRTIARRLVEAQRSSAMLTTFNEVDMTKVMDLRKRHLETFERRHGVRLGIVSFFVQAAIGALKLFPLLNAEVDGDDMLIKSYYDIGIAVGAKEGLVVPVLRDADRMSLSQIEKAIKDFARRAEEGRLTVEDIRGGTFTLTNGGVFGSLLSTPILNPPQVGILGLHKIEERPVAFEGKIALRAMMYVALSYDHRIVDGLEAVQFLVRIKELIEEPEELLLEG
jgi:2-oxoglutarate dehydrogenase E2 component (dihydrolipoamide succinyltransferase)